MIKINNIVQSNESRRKSTILEINHIEGNKIGSFIEYKNTTNECDPTVGYFQTVEVSLSGDKIVSSGYYNKLDANFSIEEINKILKNSEFRLVVDNETIKKVREQCSYC